MKKFTRFFRNERYFYQVRPCRCARRCGFSTVILYRRPGSWPTRRYLINLN